MPTDPLWFRLLQILLPALIAAASALTGVLLATRANRISAQLQSQEREAERRMRLLEPLFGPMSAAYSQVYSALLMAQAGLLKYSQSQRRADLPSSEPLTLALQTHAIWLQESSAPVLFSAAEELRHFISEPKDGPEHILAVLADAQRSVRKDLGIESFHETWQTTNLLRRAEE